MVDVPTPNKYPPCLIILGNLNTVSRSTNAMKTIFLMETLLFDEPDPIVGANNLAIIIHNNIFDIEGPIYEDVFA